MKTATIEEFARDVYCFLASAQREPILIVREGEPVAVVVGLENKDEEDMRLEASPQFWQMIDEARRQPSVRLKDIESEVLAEE